MALPKHDERSTTSRVLSDWGLWLGVVDLILLIVAWVTHSLALLTLAIVVGLLTLVAQTTTKVAVILRGRRRSDP